MKQEIFLHTILLDFDLHTYIVNIIEFDHALIVGMMCRNIHSYNPFGFGFTYIEFNHTLIMGMMSWIFLHTILLDLDLYILNFITL